MSKRKANIGETKGLRSPDSDGMFFKTIARYEHKKLNTALIFFLKGKATAFNYTHELLEVAHDDDIVLKAWVGEWRTDMFAFKLSELKDYL